MNSISSNKVNYLADSDVVNFVAWLSSNLDNPTFSHDYLNRRSNCHWQCVSLYDAFLKYDWPHQGVAHLALAPGRNYESSKKVLARLKTELRHAIEANNDKNTLLAAKHVLKWGGVIAHNGAWLEKNRLGIARLFADVQSAINMGNCSAPRFGTNTLRFNSGMSKIYSLACDDIIIYDSRVAAALGLAVLKYCQLQQLPAIPRSLQFPYMPAKEGKNQANPKQRCGSNGRLVMPRLAGAPHHFEWNLKASWLLSAIVTHSNSENSGFVQESDPLRAIEAALFMIGYDLRSATNEDASPDC